MDYSIRNNLCFSKHKELKGKTAYGHYDHYDAIEVSISFLDKYCSEQYFNLKIRIKNIIL